MNIKTDDNAFNDFLMSIKREITKDLDNRRSIKYGFKLYHYTNQAGLIGILSSNNLWATDFRFLNDSSELNYGCDLFFSILRDRLKSEDNPAVLSLISRCLAHSMPFGDAIKCYITCFCEDGDLLSQWREYSSSGGGFAIEFDVAKFFDINESLNKDRARDPYYLMKVVYDEYEQRRLFGLVIDGAIDSLTKHNIRDENDDRIPSACIFLINSILDYIIMFKHPCFSVEKEWRLVSVYHQKIIESTNFRHGVYGLTPYITLCPYPDFGHFHGKLPISGVTHGPTLDPKLSSDALGLLLKKHDYHFATVGGSCLPLRKF